MTIHHWDSVISMLCLVHYVEVPHIQLLFIFSKIQSTPFFMDAFIKTLLFSFSS